MTIELGASFWSDENILKLDGISDCTDVLNNACLSASRRVTEKLKIEVNWLIPHYVNSASVLIERRSLRVF